jgi:hypothetical protein
MSSDAKDALVDKIMEMSDAELISTVKEGLIGKYTLAVSPEDANVLDDQVRIALRILCFDMIGQGKYLISKHTRDELNAEAGKEILVSVFDNMKEVEK